MQQGIVDANFIDMSYAVLQADRLKYICTDLSRVDVIAVKLLCCELTSSGFRSLSFVHATCCRSSVVCCDCSDLLDIRSIDILFDRVEYLSTTRLT